MKSEILLEIRFLRVKGNSRAKKMIKEMIQIMVGITIFIIMGRSVADIGDHGIPILSVINSPDELIVGRFFSCYEIKSTFCVYCVLSSSAFFGTTHLSIQYLLF